MKSVIGSISFRKFLWIYFRSQKGDLQLPVFKHKSHKNHEILISTYKVQKVCNTKNVPLNSKKYTKYYFSLDDFLCDGDIEQKI